MLKNKIEKKNCNTLESYHIKLNFELNEKKKKQGNFFSTNTFFFIS